ncbi:hypothetical protein [Serratia marcescens]|uniref:hypothetical protein n=1 Tax=Serratia marcescens TaxID=615 RepID=UPI0040465D90
MDNKLSELSKPVAWKLHHHDRYYFEENADVVAIAESMAQAKGDAVYSQEYVSALLARIEELDKKETWRERQSVIDGLAGAGEAWSDIEEYMAKWDEEHRKAIGEHSVRYQCREIGEGGWMDCDKDRYDYCQRRPEMDTRTVSSPLAELEAKDKRIAELEDAEQKLCAANVTLDARASVAEAKLATPVRLPTTSGRLGVAYTRVIPEVIEAIRAAGFTVEGDE